MAERRPVGKALVLALATVLLGAGCSIGSGGSDGGNAVGQITTNDTDGLHGTRLDDPYAVPRVKLDSTTGSGFDLATDTRRPLTLVFFGYTHCPDVCTVVMSSLASAMTRLDPADRAKVDVVFVTTDPARDDLRTLTGYLGWFDPGFFGLTGPLPRIKRLGKALGVPVKKGQQLPSGGYEVTHGAQVIAVDADHRAPVIWTQGTSAADFAEDITAILRRAS